MKTLQSLLEERADYSLSQKLGISQEIIEKEIQNMRISIYDQLPCGVKFVDIIREIFSLSFEQQKESNRIAYFRKITNKLDE